MYPWLEALTFMSIGMLEPVPPQSAELIFVGDAMMHEAQIDAAHRRDGTYDYTECFSEIKPIIEAADYAVVNLETPLGGAPYSGYPCFCAPDSYAQELKETGFDLFLTANNHTLDRRDKGLCRTATVLDSLHVDHIGTYHNETQRQSRLPLIRNINGIKVGFLNYTYGTNGITPGHNVVVDYIDTVSIALDIDKARAAGAEILAVAIHWGDEYHLLPNKSQIKIGDFLLSHGVDMVIGGHPHVIQPMEMRACNNNTAPNQLIVYSLGNFISNMKTRDTRGGVMVRVRLKRDYGKKPVLEQAEYIPVFTLPADHSHNFRLVPADKPLDDKRWETARRNFYDSSRAIFDKHNINVAQSKR